MSLPHHIWEDLKLRVTHRSHLEASSLMYVGSGMSWLESWTQQGLPTGACPCGLSTCLGLFAARGLDCESEIPWGNQGEATYLLWPSSRSKVASLHWTVFLLMGRMAKSLWPRSRKSYTVTGSCIFRSWGPDCIHSQQTEVEPDVEEIAWEILQKMKRGPRLGPCRHGDSQERLMEWIIHSRTWLYTANSPGQWFFSQTQVRGSQLAEPLVTFWSQTGNP